METYTNLIHSFYSNVRVDISSLLPDIDLSTSWQHLDHLLDSQIAYDVVRDLSSLGKSVESSLINDHMLYTPQMFPLKEGTCLPDFLYPLISKLFFDNGMRRYRVPEGHADGIYCLCLRQILLAFSKLQDIEPFDVDETLEIEDFIYRISTDWYSRSEANRGTKEIDLVRYVLRDLFYECTDDSDYVLNPSVTQWVENPWGKHGPGAVAGKEKGIQKWWFKPVKGLDPQIYNLRTITGLDRQLYNSAAIDEPQSSRLCVVPKDFRGHRLICIEPKELMFAQQGLMHILNSVVRDHSLASRSIDFTDQSKSYQMSRDYSYATIDLKDASDRITLSLLRAIMPKEIFALLTRYRSRRIDIDELDQRVTPTTAFTMGNALCFPVETIVFWAISLSAMLLQYEKFDLAAAKATYQKIKADRRCREARSLRLRVFGDDIIVPHSTFKDVCEALSGFGMKINESKSCCKSPVRESCGSWWFNGQDVRITKFSYHVVTEKNYIAWISLAECLGELARSGFTQVAYAFSLELDKLHTFPHGKAGFPYLLPKGSEKRIDVRETYAICWCKTRYNIQLQRVEVQVPRIKDTGAMQFLRDSEGIYAYYTQTATRYFPSPVLQTELVWTDVHAKMVPMSNWTMK